MARLGGFEKVIGGNFTNETFIRSLGLIGTDGEGY